jgi:hypothetical protein
MYIGIVCLGNVLISIRFVIFFFFHTGFLLEMICNCGVPTP